MEHGSDLVCLAPLSLPTVTQVWSTGLTLLPVSVSLLSLPTVSDTSMEHGSDLAARVCLAPLSLLTVTQVWSTGLTLSVSLLSLSLL